jgi:hypothetical protein
MTVDKGEQPSGQNIVADSELTVAPGWLFTAESFIAYPMLAPLSVRTYDSSGQSQTLDACQAAHA